MMRNPKPARAPNRATPGPAALFAAGVLLSTLLAAAPALGAGDPPPAVSHDGLHLVPGTEAAVVYVKPDADFSVYRRVMILEAYVAFRKNWERDRRAESVHRITKNDIEAIKRQTAALLRETFVEELGGEGGYPVVGEPDRDVLLLRPAIIDLEVTAPDVGAGRSYSFASSAGVATLYLELYDSVSGEILARALDRRAADYPGEVMRWSNQVVNRAAAKKVFAGWARLLRDRLDEIHGASSGPEK